MIFSGVQAVSVLIGETHDCVELGYSDQQRLFAWLMAVINEPSLSHEHKVGGISLRLSESLLGVGYLSTRDSAWQTAGEMDREFLPTLHEAQRGINQAIRA